MDHVLEDGPVGKFGRYPEAAIYGIVCASHTSRDPVRHLPFHLGTCGHPGHPVLTLPQQVPRLIVKLRFILLVALLELHQHGQELVGR